MSEKTTACAAHNAVVDELEHATIALKHVEINQAQVLPSKEDIQQEKTHLELTHDVETFDKSQLKPTETTEKTEVTVGGKSPHFTRLTFFKAINKHVAFFLVSL